MLVNFSEREDEDWQYWIDANIAAGVSFLFKLADVEWCTVSGKKFMLSFGMSVEGNP